MVHLSTSERALLVGQTNSGKTYALRRLCARVKRLVVIDSKSTLDNWGLEPASAAAWDKLARGKPVRLRVQYENDQTYLTAIERVFDAGQVVLAIDEMYAVVPPNTAAPEALTACYSRGREYGIGVWACSQRPAMIPLIAISEAQHFFIFRLMLEKDRRRMAEFCGDDVLEPVTDPHGYYYARNGETPRYFREFGLQQTARKG